MENMIERIYRIFSDLTDVPLEQINNETCPDNVPKWDSLCHMELVLSLEDEFGIIFDDEQISKILTIELIIEAVSDLLRNNGV